MMRKIWRLQIGSQSLVVVRRADLFPRDLIAAARRVSAADIRRWLADPLSSQVLTEIAEGVNGRSSGGLKAIPKDGARPGGELWLERAFRRQELVALAVPRSFLSQAQIEAEERAAGTSAPPARPPKLLRSVQKTWVEIELVDAAGKAMAGELFRLELPDGSFHEDRLDGQGRARVEDIDPGVCELNFPDRDVSEWRAA